MVMMNRMLRIFLKKKKNKNKLFAEDDYDCQSESVAVHDV